MRTANDFAGDNAMNGPGRQLSANGQSGVDVTGGRIFVTADEDITINTPFASVSLKQGDVVLISVQAGVLAIYDLHDKSLGDVKVKIGNSTVRLSPGTAFYLTQDKSASINRLNVEGFPLRGVVRAQFNGADAELSAYTAEFSMPAALSKIDVFSKAFSSRLAGDRKMVRSLCKAAAALSVLNRNQGAFKGP